MAKSTRGSARAAKAAASDEVPKSGDRLLAAVWHGGRMFDPTKAADQVAFKKMVQEDRKKPDEDKKTGLPTAKVDLQRLADEGVVRGFGTKAKAKGKKGAAGDEGEETAEPDAPLGGGLEGSEEPPEEE